jgi:hypothetical protein
LFKEPHKLHQVWRKAAQMPHDPPTHLRASKSESSTCRPHSVCPRVNIRMNVPGRSFKINAKSPASDTRGGSSFAAHCSLGRLRSV